MTKDEFRVGINQWCFNWDKDVDGDRQLFFYEKVKFIPLEAWKVIVEDAMLSLRTFPKIKDIFTLWSTWRESNAERLIPDAPPETHCEYCDGIGLLEYEFKDEKYGWYKASQPCGYCQNWKRHISPKKWRSIKIFKVSELRDRGWEWIKPPEHCTKKEAIAAMEKMFDKFGSKPRDVYKRDPDYLKRQDNYEDIQL
jgi:hypothetical protein